MWGYPFKYIYQSKYLKLFTGVISIIIQFKHKNQMANRIKYLRLDWALITLSAAN